LKSFTKEGLTKEDWKKAGLDEQDDPEVAEKPKAAEPSSIEEIGKQLWCYLPRTHCNSTFLWNLSDGFTWNRYFTVMLSNEST
jgi:hypothetical protein